MKGIAAMSAARPLDRVAKADERDRDKFERFVSMSPAQQAG
jgi:hypothetical protein